MLSYIYIYFNFIFFITYFLFFYYYSIYIKSIYFVMVACNTRTRQLSAHTLWMNNKNMQE